MTPKQTPIKSQRFLSDMAEAEEFLQNRQLFLRIRLKSNFALAILHMMWEL